VIGVLLHNEKFHEGPCPTRFLWLILLPNLKAIKLHNSNSASYEILANCIKKIYIECLGYQQADNGYWNPEPLTETHVPNNRRTTVRAPNESTARPKKVIRISANYSVASRAADPRQYLATLTQQNLLPQIRVY
jgi:hypothetical protein